MTGNRKTVGFLPYHPSQIWVLRPVAEEVSQFADVVWALKDKDCSVALADSLKLSHTVISRAGHGLLSNGIIFFQDLFRLRRFTRDHNVDLWVTKYGAGNMAASMMGVPSISFNDDDSDVVPLIARTSYPYARLVIVPEVTRMGKYSDKAIRYKGCHELFYLHPNRFTPDDNVLKELGIDPGSNYAIVRLSALQAHHDIGIRGMSKALLKKIIELCGEAIRVFVSSEGPLAGDLEKYRLSIPTNRIHHALAFAQFFLGDSQTMTSEAAVLGTPALRINDFVGRISCIEDLEKYGLAFGYKSDQEDAFIEKFKSLMEMKNRKAEFEDRRHKFLNEKIDPVPIFTDAVRMLLDSEEKASQQGD